jgi:hypothetical protein
MVLTGIRTAILSITAPGAPVLEGQAARDLSRQTNEYVAKICNKHPSRYGFFAALPSLLDVDGSLEEISYSLDILKADGIILFTRYGNENLYLGNARFIRIWQELNKRHAVVFIHPTHAVDTNLVSASLPQPMIDYPHETT